MCLIFSKLGNISRDLSASWKLVLHKFYYFLLILQFSFISSLSNDCLKTVCFCSDCCPLYHVRKYKNLLSFFSVLYLNCQFPIIWFFLLWLMISIFLLLLALFQIIYYILSLLLFFFWWILLWNIPEIKAVILDSMEIG